MQLPAECLGVSEVSLNGLPATMLVLPVALDMSMSRIVESFNSLGMPFNNEIQQFWLLNLAETQDSTKIFLVQIFIFRHLNSMNLLLMAAA